VEIRVIGGNLSLVLNLPKGNELPTFTPKLLSLKRFKKILKWFFLSFLLVILGAYVVIQTPWGQKVIGRIVTKRLSRDLQTKVSIQHVSFSLFNKMHLQGVLVEDRDHDTLLYAGEMRVRITDWFFFKKEAELKYVGLENAVVKFQRTDSVWRQQFFLDYFSSPITGKKKKKAGIVFNLKQVELKNVLFIKKDGWLGQDMLLHVDSLNMDANALSLSGNNYDINSLYLRDPLFALHSYKGRKPVDSLAVVNAVYHQEDSAFYWNKGQGSLKIGNLKIVNGTFKTDRQNNRQPYPYFDGQNILFTDINGEISNASFIGDTIYSKLKLSAKERSGLELKNLTADIKLMPKGMAFSNLDLATNRSHLRNFFMMTYEDMSDMGNFIHKVKMTANFDDSYVDSDDLAFFAPSMGTWKKKISLKGNVRGTVDDLVGKELIIQAGNNTVLNGDITLTGLPDINQTFIDFKANNFRTTYGDVVTIIPAMRRVTIPDLRKLQYVNFKGSFTGFIRDFVTFGTIQTNLGTVTTNLNMKLPRGQEAVYSGTIATTNFRLGEFLDDPKIGTVSLKGSVKGRGFSDKTRNTLIDATVYFADYNDYRYKNINVKGQFDKKKFDGLATIRDENADLDLNGIIDFNNKTPLFDLRANVAKANLKNLHLTNDSIEFKGKLNFNFTSSTLDNFLGEARITEAEIIKDGRRLPFDSLIVSSSYVNNVKTLTAVSNEFTAKVDGDFSLKELPDAFTFFLNKYYPAYINPPNHYPKNQAIRFDITTQYVDEYIRLIDSSLSGFNFSHLYGNLNLANNELNLTAEVPQFKYKKYNFDNVNLLAKGNSNNLVLNGKAYNIRINENLNIPMASFLVNAHNDSSRVSIISGANQTLDTANLHALVLTYSDGVKIEFDPSTININGKTWSIDENGELAFRSNTPVSGQLVLREGEQQIMLKTQPSRTGNWNDLKVELTKLNVGDFSPFFMPKNRLEGLLSGTIMVEDPTNNLTIHSDDIQTQFLRLDNDSLGEVKTSLSYDNKTKTLKVKGNTLNQENYLDFDADLSFDPLKAKDNIIALKARNFQLSVLNRFLGNLFTDIRGYVTGDIDLKGAFQYLSITGKGRLKDAGLRVNFTQCFYKIQDTEIELKPTEINLTGIVLTDTVTGNPIYLTGGIEHESFRNMFYDLTISTRKPKTTNEGNNRPVLLLNTSYKDNKQFYGNVKGTGSMSLVGPQANMFMKIDAIASTRDSSTITIPPSTSRESGIADFLVERKYGREMTDSVVTANTTNIIYDVDVTANPMVTVRVVLDELTGDEIKGKGSGTLNIYSGTTEPLSLRGRFDIAEGSYLFTFQSFFKKPFELKKGVENYIEWNGDPYDANIHFDAVYKAERVSFAPIAKLKKITSGASNARGDVYVIASLRGKLFKPDIEFSLDFPNTSVAVTDPELQLIIQQMLKNPNEINRQVTYLIVFNSFAPSELGGDVSGGGMVINTISGIFLNVISDQLNKLLGNLFKNDKYNINLNTSIYNRTIAGNTLSLGSNVNLSINRAFFNNRFIISTGFGLDAPLQQSNIQQSLQLLPDVTLEWLINPSGSIRIAFFYRENADYLLSTASSGPGKAKRYGTNLTFRKDFDKLGDLFGKKKKLQPVVVPEQKPESIPPAKTEVKKEEPIKQE